MNHTPDVLICGAGIAGISTAYHLAVRCGIQNVLLVDERPPLSLTSDKSTECYRNWWPGPDSAMVSLMNRSIDLLEALAGESNNLFHLNRRGYLYLTADSQRLPAFRAVAEIPPRLGAGELRLHQAQPDDPPYLPAPAEGYAGSPEGADLLLDPDLIRTHFPYLSPSVCAGLHVRRAGWFSAQQLGMYLFSQARQHGVRLVQDRVTQVEVRKERVVAVRTARGERYAPGKLVNAAGPLLAEVGRQMGLDLPVFNELHLKVAFKDHLGVIPRHAPLLIWNDAQVLAWSPEERQLLAADPDTRWLLERMPPGIHTRPEGGGESQIILILWEYASHQVPPVLPPPLDAQYPEIALRGLATMLPGLQAYIGKAPRPVLDGGYYTKTRENRPLIGPLPVQGAYIIGALGGFGLMASCAAGELLAAHLTGAELPPYAPAFSLERYADPAYLKLLENWGDAGQL